jgi:hypothetical protein
MIIIMMILIITIIIIIIIGLSLDPKPPYTLRKLNMTDRNGAGARPPQNFLARTAPVNKGTAIAAMP